MIINVARKELKSMFSSPMGWLILAITQFILGTYFTLSFNQYFEIISLRGGLPEQMGMTQFICEGVFETASILFLFMIPLVSMRLISDEFKSQTMSFLISAPISIKEIILGKFLALVTYHSLLIISMLLMTMTLSLWVELDFGLIFANAIGLWLLMCAISAMGLFFSSQTQYAVVAGFLTFLTTAFLVLVEKFYPENTQTIFTNFSIMNHYRNFANGLMQSVDIIFFTLFATFFVLMAINRLHVLRVSE